MAGPEPYPQVKWTREQEEAYAEGRASAKGETSKGGSAPRSGSRRKRYVRTEAGARRYHVPVGAEIGSARNAKAAEAQKDTESTDRYRQLVGTDARAQAEAMQGLDDDQVKRLAQVAYSFRSSDQNVVRLRLGVAAELKRRGFNVNDFGGLGGGSARPTGPSKKKPVSASSSPTGGYYRMVRERKLSVPQLRKALGVFSKISPDKRKVVARYLTGQAIELGVPHMLGRSVIELATPDQQRVIELAGSWKHGWIPLDAAALSDKMRGRTGGKQWWSGGGSGKAVGVPKKSRKGSMLGNKETRSKYAAVHLSPENRRKLADDENKLAARKARNSANRKSRTAETREARDKYFRESSTEHLRSELKKWDDNPGAIASKSDREHVARLRAELEKRGAGKKRPGVSGRKGAMARSVAAGRAARERREASSGRTGVVKSGSTTKEASKMDLTGRTDTELEIERRAIEGVAARKQPTKEMRDKYAAIKAEQARRKAGTARAGTGGRTTGETEFEKAAKARVAAQEKRNTVQPFKRRYSLAGRDPQWLAGESEAAKVAESNSPQAAIEKIDAMIERIPNRHEGSGEERSYGMAAVRDQLVDGLIASRKKGNAGKA